ncbi:phosphocholine-specific phospholipase C [Pseudaquidulcibacter saccharophilus]|uniref:phosphocholine-specific phospholipase C n=1 Tax=Pseudaquidulcibacter saccharophilus TaxID=2831900 RepID=UPI001EFF2A4A|nr:phospholipase C, phosphocholine-specific [Pseudaquidulcibacter saccharophilus]
MTETTRRQMLQSLSLTLAAGLGMSLHPAISRALDIPADVKTGTLQDVKHIVVLMQENRAFDHYFGSLNGVCGFGDKYPIPVANNKTRLKNTVWVQFNEENKEPLLIYPFHLNTKQNFAHMRHEGTPHHFNDAQGAWNNGRLDDWTKYKHNHAMGYFNREDIPFQFALAEAFTLCDAYHCAMHSGTNPNRVMHWTGSINPDGTKNGPVIDNTYDDFSADPAHHGGYDWTTYPERLEAAGIDWQIYQNMADNFTDNPLAGFKTYRNAKNSKDGALNRLANRSIRTRDIDKLKEDVIANKLPQVSWIVGTAEGSEHPGPSSPAQGAEYIANVLDALTANPEVWAKTVFIINFDENDGLFDHVPPPSVPAIDENGNLIGASQIDTLNEYHLVDGKYKNRPYGLGPRVPCYVISPWSRGGFVNSEVFDHTSVIRFIETRFGVNEPNISPWRRAVCGDLTTCFDFKNPNNHEFFKNLPQTRELADKTRALGKGHSMPKVPEKQTKPKQEKGLRPRRAIAYNMDCGVEKIGDVAQINFMNQGANAAVFHIYDYDDLQKAPARFTIKSGGSLSAPLNASPNIQVRGSNGFHRHFNGIAKNLRISFSGSRLKIENKNGDTEIVWKDVSYGAHSKNIHILEGETQEIQLNFGNSHNWYDFKIEGDGFSYHYAGHIENGLPSMSDPSAHGEIRISI